MNRSMTRANAHLARLAAKHAAGPVAPVTPKPDTRPEIVRMAEQSRLHAIRVRLNAEIGLETEAFRFDPNR